MKLDNILMTLENDNVLAAFIKGQTSQPVHSKADPATGRTVHRCHNDFGSCCLCTVCFPGFQQSGKRLVNWWSIHLSSWELVNLTCECEYTDMWSIGVMASWSCIQVECWDILLTDRTLKNRPLSFWKVEISWPSGSYQWNLPRGICHYIPPRRGKRSVSSLHKKDLDLGPRSPGYNKWNPPRWMAHETSSWYVVNVPLLS